VPKAAFKATRAIANNISLQLLDLGELGGAQPPRFDAGHRLNRRVVVAVSTVAIVAIAAAVIVALSLP
jgi:hypothetical protein